MKIDEIERGATEDDTFFKNIATIVETKGAVILRNLIDADTATSLKKALTDCILEDEKKFGRGYIFYGMVHALMTRNKVFLDLLEETYILKSMRSVLGHGAIVHAFNSSSMSSIFSLT